MITPTVMITSMRMTTNTGMIMGTRMPMSNSSTPSHCPQ